MFLIHLLYRQTLDTHIWQACCSHHCSLHIWHFSLRKWVFFGICFMLQGCTSLLSFTHITICYCYRFCCCSGIADFPLNRQTGSKNSYSVSEFHLYIEPWHAQMGNACRTVKPSQSPECVTSVIVLIRQCHRLSPVTFIAHLNILLRQMVRMSRLDTELLSLSSLPWRQNAELVSTRLF